MADSNPPKRGFTFKSKSGQVANQSLQAALEPVKPGDKQPSSKKPAVVIKAMFGAVPKPKKNVGLSLKKPAPVPVSVPVAEA